MDLVLSHDSTRINEKVDSQNLFCANNIFTGLWQIYGAEVLRLFLSGRGDSVTR